MADLREAAAVLQDKIEDLHRLITQAEREVEERQKQVTYAKNDLERLKTQRQSLADAKEFMRESNYDTEYWKG